MFFIRTLAIPEFLDPGPKGPTLHSGRWTLDDGLWTMDPGLWMLESRL